MSGYQDHYKILGIRPGASFKEIKKAYYRQVKQCHPDLFGGSRDKEEEFKLLVLSFDILSDPDKRRKFDVSSGVAAETPSDWSFDEESIMDRESDDTLEEIIVGNEPPDDTTLATLFLDLERTEVFMTFREGKNYFRSGQYQNAFHYFKKAVDSSPSNILYRYYMGKTLLAFGNFSEARMHFNIGIRIGEGRVPPQRLKRFHDELEGIEERRNPRWKKFVDFLGGKHRFPEYLDAEEGTIRETNRAIARIMADRRKKTVTDRRLLK